LGREQEYFETRFNFSCFKPVSAIAVENVDLFKKQMAIKIAFKLYLMESASTRKLKNTGLYHIPLYFTPR